MKPVFNFLAIGALIQFLPPVLQSSTVPAVWPQPVILQPGQHVHTPKHHRDFELTFHVKLEGRMVVDLPRAARIDMRGTDATYSGPTTASSWRMGVPSGTWTKARLIRIGSVVDLWIDGQRQSGHSTLGNPFVNGGWDAIAKNGPLVFEAHNAQAELDKVIVRELRPADAVAYLSSRGPDNRMALPITEDMAGWAGATAAVQVGNGMMTWKEGERGKILYWSDVLKDFEFEFEFKVTQGANNGVVLRYSGTGRAIHASICEIQIVDQDYAAVSKPIETKKLHGSAYGMAAARQGYQHAVGEWNHQKITVRGLHVLVELNGTTILDADLRAIPESEILGGKRLEGLGRDSGYVGFAGHGDIISFKNIYLRKI